MAPRSFVFISRRADDEGEHGVDGYPKGESTFATYIVYVGEDWRWVDEFGPPMYIPKARPRKKVGA